MHGRHAGKDGDLLQRDVLGDGGRVEAGVQDDLDAEAQPEDQDRRHGEDVEERQDAQRALLALDHRRRIGPRRRLPVLRVGRGQVGVGQHRPFRRAGRAAGILDDRERVGRIGDRVGLIAPVVVDEIAEGDVPVVGRDLRQHALRRHERLHHTGGAGELRERPDDQLLQPRRLQELLGLGIDDRDIERDEDVGLAVGDLELERGEGVERRIIDHHAPRLQDAEQGDHRLGRIGHVEADVHAGSDAELLEARGRAVGERVQFGVAQALVHELQRRTVAESASGRLQHALKRRRLDRRVPADAGGIRLYPRLSVHRLPHVFLPDSVERPAVVRRPSQSMGIGAAERRPSRGARRLFYPGQFYPGQARRKPALKKNRPVRRRGGRERRP